MEMTQSLKRNLSLLIAVALVMVGSLYQMGYDSYSAARRARVRGNFIQSEGRQPSEGWVTNLFFYVKKAKTWDEVDEKSRELLEKV